MIPNDTLTPKETSGLRIGFAAVTTRGCTKEDAIIIGKLIHKYLANEINDEDAHRQIANIIKNWKIIEEI